MVFTRAGIVVAAFGLAMVAFPKVVLRYQRWRFPEETIDYSAERIKTVRYGGVVFLAIGAAFLGGDQLGVL